MHSAGRWMVYIARHAFALVDGVIHDTGGRPRAGVKRAWRIEGAA